MQQTDGCVRPGVICVVFRPGVDVFVVSPLRLQRRENHKRVVFSVDPIDLDLVHSFHRAESCWSIISSPLTHAADCGAAQTP